MIARGVEMKATLTIEVPDDFKKHHCSKCPVVDYCAYYDIFPCPLELQDIPKAEPPHHIGEPTEMEEAKC